MKHKINYSAMYTQINQSHSDIHVFTIKLKAKKSQLKTSRTNIKRFAFDRTRHSLVFHYLFTKSVYFMFWHQRELV